MAKRDIKSLKVGDMLKFNKSCSLGWCKAGETYMVSSVDADPFSEAYTISVYFTHAGVSSERYSGVSDLNYSKVKLVK